MPHRHPGNVNRPRVDDVRRSMDQAHSGEPRRDAKNIYERHARDRHPAADKGAESGRQSRNPSADDLSRAENEGMGAPQRH
jgi:hypothetical protein